MKHQNFNATEFRVALARNNTNGVAVAAELKIPYSTAVGYWTGRYAAPVGFRDRVEGVLHLKSGTLKPRRTRTKVA